MTIQKTKRKKRGKKYKEKISFDKTELVQSAGEGRDATVKCSVQGDPRPDVSWLYNGEYINSK